MLAYLDLASKGSGNVGGCLELDGRTATSLDARDTDATTNGDVLHAVGGIHHRQCLLRRLDDEVLSSLRNLVRVGDLDHQIRSRGVYHLGSGREHDLLEPIRILDDVALRGHYIPPAR